MTKYVPNMGDHWKLRCVAATRGNTDSLMGAVFLAMIGHVPPRRPFFKGLAMIDKAGIVWARLYSRGLLMSKLVPLGKIGEWTDELRRLADLTHMNDQEVHELFDEFRKWIERDHRAKSRLD